jgi:hypothetical protein
MARRSDSIHPHPDDGRPTVDMDPTMLASLVQQSITIPISLADLELADEPEPSKQVTQPIPAYDTDAKTFVRSSPQLPPTTRGGTGAMANTWFQRVCRKLHLG